MKDKKKEGFIRKDISFKENAELKKVIEELKKRESLYSRLIELSPFAIIIHSAGRIVFANKSACRLLNISREKEIIGKEFLDIISPDFREMIFENLAKILKDKEEKLPFEMEILLSDGKTKWVEIFNSYIEFHEKPSIVSIFFDITDRKLTEEKYKRLFNNIFDGVYQCTPEGKILTANPALARMLKYDSEEELLSKTIRELFPNPEERDYLVKRLEKNGELRNFEIERKKKNGSIAYLIDNSIAIKDKSGKVIFIEGTLTDITKRKIAEKELKMSYEKLKRIVESVINAMVKMVEKKDPYTAGHERHVAILASAIGRELGFSEEKVEEIKMTALIHDIGKMFIPSEILVKPGKLTEEEFAFIRLHTYHGFEILKTIDFPWDVAPVVLQHHERFDGSGYPQGLKGDEISIEARVLSVADVIEAITFHRPYRPGHGIEKAIQEISQFKGSLFDPDVVDACLKVFKEKRFKFENKNS